MRPLDIDLAALRDVGVADLGAQVAPVRKDLAGDGVPSVILGQRVFDLLDQGRSALQVLPNDGLGHRGIAAVRVGTRGRLALLCRGPVWLTAGTRKETEEDDHGGKLARGPCRCNKGSTMFDYLLEAFSGPGRGFMYAILVLLGFALAVAIERAVLLLMWRAPSGLGESLAKGEPAPDLGSSPGLGLERRTGRARPGPGLGCHVRRCGRSRSEDL